MRLLAPNVGLGDFSRANCAAGWGLWSRAWHKLLCYLLNSLRSALEWSCCPFTADGLHYGCSKQLKIDSYITGC